MFPRPKPVPSVVEALTATQLADMAYCERKVVLAYLYGPRTSPRRRGVQARGILEHDLFRMEARRINRLVISDFHQHAHTHSSTPAAPIRALLASMRALLAWCHSRSK